MHNSVQHTDKLFVGGEWVSPATSELIEVISPHTEEPVARVAAASPSDVDKAVAAARQAFDHGPWPRLDPAERIEVIRRLAKIYGERRPEMADVITSEVGAPTSFANRAQVGLPWNNMNVMAGIAESYTWLETRPGAYGKDVFIRKEPLGVVAAIVPWNMPQFLIVAKLVPALLAGCTVIVKPAPESPLDALLLAEMLQEIGLPEGVVSVLPATRETSSYLVSHPGIDKVSFTGSTESGRSVALACAPNLTKLSLELGGKSAAIALEDANPAAVAAAVRVAGAGMAWQICNAMTRVLAPAKRVDEFAEALGAAFAALKVGDPTDPDTEIGPLVAERQQDRVRGYIESGLSEGARIVTGGAEMPAGMERGWYVQPTVFTDATNSMKISREEIFGPVITVIPYTDEADAIRLANDSEYGLAGAVFTADEGRGLKVAEQVRAGTFGVNGGYAMDPAASFGGVKNSGYGRELGREGLEAYLDIKSITVAG